MFYKETALRILDAYLEPTEHVIIDLKESRESISFFKPRKYAELSLIGERMEQSFTSRSTSRGSIPHVEPTLESINPDDCQKSGYVIVPASKGEKDVNAE